MSRNHQAMVFANLEIHGVELTCGKKSINLFSLLKGQLGHKWSETDFTHRFRFADTDLSVEVRRNRDNKVVALSIHIIPLTGSSGAQPRQLALDPRKVPPETRDALRATDSGDKPDSPIIVSRVTIWKLGWEETWRWPEDALNRIMPKQLAGVLQPA